MREHALKKPLTDNQIEHLEEHVPYELLMLRFTLGKLRTEKHPLAWNAILSHSLYMPEISIRSWPTRGTTRKTITHANF